MVKEEFFSQQGVYQRSKRIFTAMLAVILLAGIVPYTPAGELFGNTVITANAATYTSGNRVNFTNCSTSLTFTVLGLETTNILTQPVYKTYVIYDETTQSFIESGASSTGTYNGPNEYPGETPTKPPPLRMDKRSLTAVHTSTEATTANLPMILSGGRPKYRP